MRLPCWLTTGSLLAAFILSVGCGSQTASTDLASKPAGAPDVAGARLAVETFLGAIKAGDDITAEKLLTKLALEETKKHEMAISPPGSSTVRYEVLEVEAVDGGAHVLSRWTDQFGGEERSDEFIWVLRYEGDSWRIAGMITKPFDDLPPVVLDFEDPEYMEQQQRLVMEEMARRERAARGMVDSDPQAVNDPFAVGAPQQGESIQNAEAPPTTAGRPAGARVE